MELEALSALAGRFAASGATLVMISPQLPEHNTAIAKEKGISADILSDPGNAVAARYGLKYQMPGDLIAIYQQFGVDIPKHNGDDSWTLPIPATLIVGGDGMVRHANISADYTSRPEPEATLAAMKRLS
jgi:peroxiredoxin